MNETNTRSNILSLRYDEPTELDSLGFAKQVGILGRMLEDPNLGTPFCIGIYGEWGKGKTSFMKQLEAFLKGEGRESGKKGESAKTVIPVWFNPWSYEREEHLIIPFLKTIQLNIKEASKGDAALIEAAKTVGMIFSSFVYAVKMGIKIPGLELEFDPTKQKSAYDAMTKEQKARGLTFANTLTSHYYDAFKYLKEVADKLKGKYRIVVFIDDLDRCLPDKVIRLLESIKLFLNLEGYLFIIGVDRKVVEKGIQEHYRHLDKHITAKDYLEKMVQLPLELPPVEGGKRLDFIKSVLQGNDAYADHADIIDAGVAKNPRTLKRFVNLLAFTTRVAEEMKVDILANPNQSEHHEAVKTWFNPILYVKWCIILFSHPEHHEKIKDKTEWLLDLQRECFPEAEQNDKGKKGDSASLEEEKRMDIHPNLREVLKKGIDDETQRFPNDPWVLKHFVHLSESAPVAVDDRKKQWASRNYQPGDMVRIPQGKFLYGEEKREENIEEYYFIDVFPVTNRQYCDFLNDRKPASEELGKWMDVEGKLGNEKCRISQEGDGYSVERGYENHPVIYVSWHGAKAFCLWRSEKEGKPFKLPTELQWERAARWTDGREYPWGNEFDKERCNTAEAGIGGTSDVMRFPGGASHDECREMAGNVWEWTDSWYGVNEDSRTLRGGSWDYGCVNARCAYRGRFYPVSRINDVGFRCVRTP